MLTVPKHDSCCCFSSAQEKKKTQKHVCLVADEHAIPLAAGVDKAVASRLLGSGGHLHTSAQGDICRRERQSDYITSPTQEGVITGGLNTSVIPIVWS